MIDRYQKGIRKNTYQFRFIRGDNCNRRSSFRSELEINLFHFMFVETFKFAFPRARVLFNFKLARERFERKNFFFFFEKLLQIQILRIPYEGKKGRGVEDQKTSFPTTGFSVNTRPFARGNAALTVRVPRMEQIYRSVESL